jgi:hypothetical protein
MPNKVQVKLSNKHIKQLLIRLQDSLQYYYPNENKDIRYIIKKIKKEVASK